jgi:uncharacterized membrane protein
MVMTTSSFHTRLHRKKHLIKNFKEQANKKRKFSEKIADFMTASFGTILFLLMNAVFFMYWFLINTGMFPSIRIFDPYPFGLLTVLVSLEAIFLAIFVLISQNRAQKIADFREEVALQIDTLAEEEISKMIELQTLLLKKQGIDVSKDPEIKKMLATDDIEKIEEKLEKQLFS